MKISEPVTMLTDYALAVANLFFTISTFTNYNSQNRVVGLLLFLGFSIQMISAIAGGTFHGFAEYLQASGRQSLWNIVLVTIGASVAFLAAGVHAANVRREDGMWIAVAVAVGVVGLLIQRSGFRTRQPFNHNDIFHVIQIVAMFLFFMGARNLCDRGYSPK